MLPKTLFPDGTATALTLADLTSPGLIIPHLRGQEAASTIKELSQVLQREQRVPDLKDSILRDAPGDSIPTKTV